MNREARRHPQSPNGNIQLLPQIAAQAQQATGPIWNVGPLMGLDQLICFTAAHYHEMEPEDAVKLACEIVAHATKHAMIGTVQKRIAELQAEHNAAQKPQEASTLSL